jgi:hypothetical protein
MSADNVRAVSALDALEMDTMPPYAWPLEVACRSCNYTIGVVILADDLIDGSRARAVRAVDDYLEAKDWRPRHGGNDLCPTCRASDEQIAQQVNSLTAPGTGYGDGSPTDGQVVEQLDKLTAQPSAFSALNNDDDSPASDGPIRDQIDQLTSPWQCRVCQTENPPTSQTCKRCGTPKPKPDPVDDGEIDEDEWTCPVCGAGNDQETDDGEPNLVCENCGNSRPEPE